VSEVPGWVRRQLDDVAGLLSGSPERTKVEFRRLGVEFVMHPIHEEGVRPFYRAIGTTSIAHTLSGAGQTDLDREIRRGHSLDPFPHAPKAASPGSGGSAPDPYTLARGGPTIPAPFAWLTRFAPSLLTCVAAPRRMDDGGAAHPVRRRRVFLARVMLARAARCAPGVGSELHS
jgi:hypothetical protein